MNLVCTGKKSFSENLKKWFKNKFPTAPHQRNAFQPKPKKMTRNGCFFELKVVISEVMVMFLKSWSNFLKLGCFFRKLVAIF